MFSFNCSYSDIATSASGDEFNDDGQLYFEDESEDINPMDIFSNDNADSNFLPTFGFDDSSNNATVDMGGVCNNAINDLSEGFNCDQFNKDKKPNFECQLTNYVSSSFPSQKQKRKRNGYVLNPSAQSFQKKYYKLVTKGKRKVVRKELIARYHKLIHGLNIGVRPLLRDPTRIVNIYFNTYADQETLILTALNQLISQGAINYEIDYETLASQKK